MKSALMLIGRLSLALTFAAPLLLTPNVSLAATAEPVMLNFVNADIESVVRAIGKATKRNFVVDPRVKGVINVVSSSPVAPSLAYDIMLTALRLQGFSAVERNGATVILPESEAKFRSSAVRSQGKIPHGEHLMTE